MNRKGMALVAIIILVIFVGLAVGGVTTFIAQRLIQVDTQQRDMRCRYNAQAGLHYALYQYRNTGTPFSGTVTIDSNNSARVSTAGGGGAGAASGLVIDARTSSLASGNRNLVGITLSNSSASAITIDRMIITWTGNRTLQNIVINGITVWSGNIATSPANVNIANFTLSAGTSYPLTRIRWSGSMNGRTMTLQCVMTDATTTSVCTVYPPPASVCQTSSSLTIQSTGRTAGSGMYRTVQAAYNTSTGNVSDYEEITTAVP